MRNMATSRGVYEDRPTLFRWPRLWSMVRRPMQASFSQPAEGHFGPRSDTGVSLKRHAAMASETWGVTDVLRGRIRAREEQQRFRLAFHPSGEGIGIGRKPRQHPRPPASAAHPPRQPPSPWRGSRSQDGSSLSTGFETPPKVTFCLTARTASVPGLLSDGAHRRDSRPLQARASHRP